MYRYVSLLNKLWYDNLVTIMNKAILHLSIRVVFSLKLQLQSSGREKPEQKLDTLLKIRPDPLNQCPLSDLSSK